ncbi:hypothetical protein I79_005776 [Cricetulus griseus]|uniref:Uncharacterized protein n=1 Tax=Cricetulus griseus TaxID=10029 RepID=G3H623_CRIGR|nr:hypothetical protein I79_005776 [Cricetulus griseus]
MNLNKAMRSIQWSVRSTGHQKEAWICSMSRTLGQCYYNKQYFHKGMLLYQWHLKK